MFFIFESIIIFFPKHRIFVVIHEKNYAYRQSKTSEDLWSPWEDEEWKFKRPQKTLQREELCFQVPRDQGDETWVFSTERHTHAPIAQKGTPGAQELYAQRLTHECRRLTPKPPLTHVWRMVLGTWRLFLAGQGAVLWFFGEEISIF